MTNPKPWACVSVVSGWQTRDATGALFGPVFNSTNDLWKWQGAERVREAAPDLLAALQEAEIHTQRAWDRAHPDDIARSLTLALETIRAAIAKAEGVKP